MKIQRAGLLLLCELFIAGTGTSSSGSRLPLLSAQGQNEFPGTFKSRISSSIEVFSRPRRASKRQKVSNCTCGMKPVDEGRIVGGQLVDGREWPWVVPLVQVGDSEPRQFCGASIINTQYVLTAAHCAVEMIKNIRKYQVYLGTNSISYPNPIQSNISVIKVHRGYNSNTLENDIALVKLTRPMQFTDQVYPICLNQNSATFVGYTGTVTGWGSQKQGEMGVDRLRQTNVKILNNADCARNYSAAKIKIVGSMLCASSPPRDACQGDSGGPLFVWNSKSKTFTEAGIVSFGLNCGSRTFPGVYTRVSSFIRWIQDNTRDAAYCLKSF